MDDFYIPLLHSFAMKNPFTGSKGNFRFRLVPAVENLPNSKEVDFANSTITAEFWHGPFCYECSQVEETKVFPLTEEGRAQMIDWLIANI